MTAPAKLPLDRSRVEEILRLGVQRGASDVHFKAGERVMMRINGRLHRLNLPPLAPEDSRRVYESLRPPHAERPGEELREVDFSLSVSGAGRFRVNAFQQRGSLALVIRVIPIQIPELADLNLPSILPALANERRGLVLVTGTTGSGKSTTLAAMIDQINKTRTAHVVTIEDPIEFLFANQKSSIVQREVGVDTGSFSVALRAALRQDPDVIMVGEMRDLETIDIALKAAETGHLVLSTAHTTDAAKTIQRILAVFPSAEQNMVRIRLAECLRAVVSQRLLPRADGSGLIPAVETMVVTRVIQDCIRNPERNYEINEFVSKGRNYGMQTFDQALLRLLRRGLITREVAISAATSPGDLDLQLRMGIDEDELAIEGHRQSSYHEVPLPFGLPPAEEAPGEDEKDLELAPHRPPPPAAAPRRPGPPRT
jgi:twitching motility protein PilT